MTIRKAAKWAKATKTPKGWIIARGFRGNIKAAYVDNVGSNKTLGAVMMVNWLKDQ